MSEHRGASLSWETLEAIWRWIFALALGWWLASHVSIWWEFVLEGLALSWLITDRRFVLAGAIGLTGAVVFAIGYALGAAW